MKHVKKITVLLLVAAMLLSMTASVFAASDGSVTLNNATAGEEYRLYKVFDLTYIPPNETSSGTEGGDALKEGVAYTYTKTGATDALYNALTASGSPFTLTATTTENVYQVTKKNDATAETISAWLKNNQSLLTEATPTSKTGFQGTTNTAAGETVAWNGLPYGYYYVTSSLGATVTIDSTLKDVIIKDKNSIPSEDKKQAIGTTAPANESGYGDGEVQAQVGDKVWYQIAVTDGKGTNQDIVITDTLTDGLTFDNNIKVYKNGTEVTSSATTWVKSDPAGSDTFTYKLTLKAAYVASLEENDVVYIRYSATVNGKAASDPDATKETNTAVLTYSHQTSTDSTDVVTYKFQLDKVKNQANNYADLLGAQFEIYRGSVSNANKVYFKQGAAENGVPVLTVVPSTESGAFSLIALTDDTSVSHYLNSSKVIIKGLDKDSYVLREVKAPAGYNIAEDTTLADTDLLPINGTIVDNANSISDTGVISVINNTGSELPSTGGIGTTLFYLVGSLFAVGAAVLLVVKKRMQGLE